MLLPVFVCYTPYSERLLVFLSKTLCFLQDCFLCKLTTLQKTYGFEHGVQNTETCRRNVANILLYKYIYIYIYICVRLVGVFEELSTRMHGTENFTIVYVFVVLEFKDIGLWSSGI
jgi:hypothetical protein